MSAPSGGDIEAQPFSDETQPLKGNEDSVGYGANDDEHIPMHAKTTPAIGAKDGDETEPKSKLRFHRIRAFVFKECAVQDSMTYHAEDLSSWSSLWHMTYTVWNRQSLWLVSLNLLLVSLSVALLVLFTTRDPAMLKVSKFTEITNFLRVFVGLLLGFFMSASVNRWWSCAQAFQHLTSSVRNLHTYLNSLGVPEEQTTMCLRYGCVSAWLLHLQLHVEALPSKEQEARFHQGWEEMKSCQGRDEVFGSLLPEEVEALQSASDPPGTLWMWIGSLVGRLAQDGLIPPMASPTFGKIMGVTVEGFNAIRDVRASISMQAPFIYVQMLSSLVHINNIVNAVSFGLTSGASLGTLLVHYDVHVFTSHHTDASEKEATADMQTLLVSFFFSCFGPFVYQALLEVSIAIAQPFSNKDAVVPTHRILNELEKDLHDSMRLAKLVSWSQPCFQEPKKAPAQESPVKEFGGSNSPRRKPIV